MEGDITQTCECGNDTYHIKLRLENGESLLWAECAACERPTGSVGDREMQHRWMVGEHE